MKSVDDSGQQNLNILPLNVKIDSFEGSSSTSNITDPSGRFERSNEILGRGASKEVYKAFDLEEGKEVAWNQLKVDNLSEQSAAKILSEIQILTQLDNENIIRFYHSWSKSNHLGYFEIFFITELMTSGTLKAYLQKTKGPIKLKVIKGWAKQILKALYYLHTKNPPIIHRDLKCDNIFINGNNGQTKLGDFGLAVLKNREMLTSVLGTPEFMAPELYEESYDEKVDVYAFGMCLLEMVTKDYPYSECDNAAQIYRKVTQGIKPLALQKVTDPETLQFIEMCIDPLSSNRPTVEELLNHVFMNSTPDEGKVASTKVEEFGNASPQQGQQHLHYDDNDAAYAAGIPLPLSPTTTVNNQPEGQSFLIERESEEKASEVQSTTNCQVEIINLELPIVHLKIKLSVEGSTPMNKEIKFPFNFINDTVGVIIEEMIKENVLGPKSEEFVSNAIREAIKEPLAAYEMLAAKAPARAEITEHQYLQHQIQSTLLSNNGGDLLIKNIAIESFEAPHSTLLPITGVSGNQTFISSNIPQASNMTSPTLLSSNTSPYPLLTTPSITIAQPTLIPPISETGEINNVDLLIQNHPEVAALLLRQKKEIELLALFHRREHQALLSNLRRQLMVSPFNGSTAIAQSSSGSTVSNSIWSRQDSIATPTVKALAQNHSSVNNGSAMQAQIMPQNVLSLQTGISQGYGQNVSTNNFQQTVHSSNIPPSNSHVASITSHATTNSPINSIAMDATPDEVFLFMSKVRRLMFETTGNSAWLPANNNESSSSNPIHIPYHQHQQQPSLSNGNLLFKSPLSSPQVSSMSVIQEGNLSRHGEGQQFG